MANDTTDEQILKGLLDTLVMEVLRAGPNYGFGIREQLDRLLGTDAGLVKEATLYPLLHRLERNGHLASHHEPGDRGSPRKYYRLTPEGEAFLARRVAEWGRVTALLRRTLLAPDRNPDRP